jgi:type I restriction enzyme, S subunit
MSGQLVEQWPMTTLGELCEVITKGTTPTSVGFQFQQEGINFVKIESITREGSIIENKLAKVSQDCHDKLKRSQLQEGDILFSIAGALGRTTLVAKDILPANTNQALAIIRLIKSEYVLPEYVLKALSTGYTLSQIEKYRGGAAQQNLSLTQMKAFKIPLPPLEEQRRIVSILDEAFEIISISQKNSESEFNSAIELLESHINSIFENPSNSWKETILGDVISLEYGKPLPKEDRDPEGAFPVYGANGEKARSNKFYHSTPTIIVGRKGSAGELNLTEGKFWPLDVTYFVTFDEEKYEMKFLYYLLQRHNLPSMAKGVKPGINRNDVYALKVKIPSIEVQQQIVRELDVMVQQVSELMEISRNKSQHYLNLKQSILQEAFNGTLRLAEGLADQS